MPVIPNPSAGGAVNASAQVLYQRELVLNNPSFGDRFSVYGQPPTTGFNTAEVPVRVNGLPSIRVNLLLYPEYETGLATFRARNFIAWRLVAVLPPLRPREYDFLIPEAPATVATDARYTPLSTPQLLPVGVPISYEVPTGGAQDLMIQFSADGGSTAGDQGEDLVLISFTAAGG